MENRVIKFRAWDKFNGCYWYSDKLNSLAKFFELLSNLSEGGNELILEQFTGLTDIHGKDIYEGDIITNEAITHAAKGGWLVEFDRGCFGCKGMALRAIQGIEVIGNKFEHPEFLKS